MRRRQFKGSNQHVRVFQQDAHHGLYSTRARIECNSTQVYITASDSILLPTNTNHLYQLLTRHDAFELMKVLERALEFTTPESGDAHE